MIFGAIYIGQQVQSAVGVGVPVESMHVQIPGSFTRYARPVTLPFQPRWGLRVRLRFAVTPFLVLASAVLIPGVPCLGPCFMGGLRSLYRDGSDWGISGA